MWNNVDMSADNRLGIEDPSLRDLGLAEKSYRSVLAGEIPSLGELYRNTRTRIALALSGVGMFLLTACGAPVQKGPDTGSTQPPPASAEGLTPGPKLPVVTNDGQIPPKETPTPVEVKKLNCDILSPEACATGEYIEWTRPDGEKLRGIGFVLKPGEEIRLPKEGLLVSTKIIQQPSAYRGVQVIAKTPDNSETYQYYGRLAPDKLKESDLPPNTAGIIGDSDLTVFEDQPYNLIFKGPDPFMEKFAPITKTKDHPKVINNKVPGNQAANIALFYGLTPPKP